MNNSECEQNKKNHYYIKVEAVNIYAHLGDSNQLSMIRGGSLLLKKAIDDIATEFFTEEGEAISTGASSGFFRTQDTDKSRDISNWLNGIEVDKHDLKLDYHDFTFVVDQVEAENLQDAKEKLIALGRMRQMQQLSVSCDRPDEEGQHLDDGELIKPSEPSELSDTRVATRKFKVQEKLKKGSIFDETRFDYGRDQRAQLYIDELEALKTQFDTRKDQGENSKELELANVSQFGFTHTLNTLAACGNTGNLNNEIGNLNNKIAVIYFDGNGFGSIQQEAGSDDKEQKAFDNRIKCLRRLFLNKLLRLYEKNKPDEDKPSRYFHFEKDGKDPGNKKFHSFPKKQARLETILWGGDEMTLIVPAWLGFEILCLFYKESANWKPKDDGKVLTHAGGLVFCNRKTPVFRIRQLAQDLADAVKESDGGREGNFFDYMVLESVDYPTTRNLTQHRIKTYGATLAHYRPSRLSPIKYEDWKETSADIKTLFEGLPRSQFYRLVKEMRDGFDQWDALSSDITDNLWQQLLRQETRLCRFIDEKIVKDFDQWVDNFFKIPKFNLSDIKNPQETDDTDTKNNKQHPAEVNVANKDPMAVLAARVWVYIYTIELWDYLLHPVVFTGDEKQGKKRPDEKEPSEGSQS